MIPQLKVKKAKIESHKEISLLIYIFKTHAIFNMTNTSENIIASIRINCDLISTYNSMTRIGERKEFIMELAITLRSS